MINYVASFKAGTSDDLIHFGVKGMKWGVINRSDSKKKSSGGLSKNDPSVRNHGKVKTEVDRRKLMADLLETTRKSPVGLVEVNSGVVSHLVEFGREAQRRSGKEINFSDKVVADLVRHANQTHSMLKKHKRVQLDADNILALSMLGSLDEARRQKKLRIGDISADKGTARKEVMSHSSVVIEDSEDYLMHFGVKGMKWGVRNDSRPTSDPKRARLPGTKNTILGGGEHYRNQLNYMKLNKKTKAIMSDRDVSSLVRYGEIQRKLHVNNEKRISRKLTSEDKQKYRKLRRRANFSLAEFTKDEIEFLVDYGFNRTEAVRITRNTASNLALPAYVLADFAMSDDVETPDYVGAYLADRDSVGGAMTMKTLKMGDQVAPDDYAGVLLLSDLDISHYGVKGMKWGIRNDQPGSKLATHRAKVDAKHLARDKQLSNKGTRIKRGLVTDFTVSPYRSVGRLRRKQERSLLSPLKGIKFEQLTGKQQSKLHKSLARDLSKLKEKQLPKSQRGKTDYLKMVKNDPKLRDALVRQHASLWKVGHRNVAMGETRKKAIFTQTNWPKILLGPGYKTTLAANTLGISALATRAISRHSSDISEQDYVGTDSKSGIAHFVLPSGGGADPKDLMHYGVKGMKWGVRRSELTVTRSKSVKPTRARAREERNIARTKEIERLVGLKQRIESGKTVVSRNGKKLSTDQAIKAIDAKIEGLAKRNPVAVKKGLIVDPKIGKPSTKDDPLIKTVDSSNESSVDRYNRLRAEVAKKGANSLGDEDLKFLNTRREALAKANVAYKKKDSMLRKVLDASLESMLNKQLGDATADLGNMHLKPRLGKLVSKTQRFTPLPPTPTP